MLVACSRGVRAALVFVASCLCVSLATGSARAAIDIATSNDSVTTSQVLFDFGNPGGNVERLDTVMWKEGGTSFGPNLADDVGSQCVAGDPSDSWGRADSVEGMPRPVGDGTTGTWEPRGLRTVEIDSSRSEVCSGDSVVTPVRTRYTFFDTGASADEVRMERTIAFSALNPEYMTAGMRAYVPELPSSYNHVLYLTAAKMLENVEVAENTHSSPVSWSGSWLAINNPTTNAGVLILRDPASPGEAQLQLENVDGANSSSIELLTPLGGWHAPTTETEWLCFYDSTSWPTAKRATQLPSGCSVVAVPIDESPPVITGEPRVGTTLTATEGTWVNALSYAYQWSRCAAGVCTPIAGATASTYVPSRADEGAQLRAEVTATAAGGESDTASEVTGGVRAAPPAAPESTTLPTITGEARATEPLQGSGGNWAGGPTEFVYQWLRCETATGESCTAIPGAATTSFTPTAEDVGYTVRLQEIAINTVGSTAAESRQTAIVQPEVMRAHFSVSTTPCTGVPLVLDASGSKTPNPPIVKYQYSYAQVPLIFVGVSKTLEEVATYLTEFDLQPEEILNTSSPKGSLEFTWDRPAGHGYVNEPFSTGYARDPIFLFLTTTDLSGAKATVQEYIRFHQEYSKESRAGCPTLIPRKTFTLSSPSVFKLSGASAVRGVVKCVTATPCAGSIKITQPAALFARASARRETSRAEIVLARSSLFDIAGSHKATITAKLTKAGRRLRHHRGPEHVLVKLTSVDATGHALTRTFKETLHLA
jgi:hypothetical protein